MRQRNAAARVSYRPADKRRCDFGWYVNGKPTRCRRLVEWAVTPPGERRPRYRRCRQCVGQALLVSYTMPGETWFPEAHTT